MNATAQTRTADIAEAPFLDIPPDKLHDYDRKSTIYGVEEAGLNVYYIISGLVAVYRLHSDGKEGITDVVGPGGALGADAVISGKRNPFEMAIAIEPTRTQIWSAETVTTALKHGHISNRLLEILAQKNQRQDDRIERLLLLDAEQRLAQTLISFGKNFGKVLQNGDVELPRFSQDVLSDIVGATRSRISHFMAEFKRKGFISCRHECVVILQGNRLEEWLGEPLS